MIIIFETQPSYFMCFYYNLIPNYNLFFCVFQTQGTAPPKPQHPGLKEATKSSLHLVWNKRLTDSEFILHMDDQISGHGFLPVYTGSDTSHISTGLRRNAAYKFRLQVNISLDLSKSFITFQNLLSYFC